MSDVTKILAQIDAGDPRAAEQLLPLVYDELRKLAAARLAHERPGQTLQATALVHEAYLRLVGGQWDRERETENRGRRSEVRGQKSEERDPTSDFRLPTSDSLAPTPQPLAHSYNSRGHFFASAAEAMRRILVEQARRKNRVRHGGELHRVKLEDVALARIPDDETILAVDEAVARLAEDEPETAEIVKLHFFAGLTLDETAAALNISRASVYRHWAFARASLRVLLGEGRGEK